MQQRKALKRQPNYAYHAHWKLIFRQIFWLWWPSCVLNCAARFVNGLHPFMSPQRQTDRPSFFEIWASQWKIGQPYLNSNCNSCRGPPLHPFQHAHSETFSWRPHQSWRESLWTHVHWKWFHKCPSGTTQPKYRTTDSSCLATSWKRGELSNNLPCLDKNFILDIAPISIFHMFL